MEQAETMEVDSNKESSPEPEEKETQDGSESQDASPEQSDKPADNEEDEGDMQETDALESEVIEWDKPEDTSEVQNETTESNEQEETSSANVVVMDDEISESEIVDVEKSVPDKQCDESAVSEEQEDGNEEEPVNPLAASTEQDTEKPESEPDLEVIDVDMSSAKSDSAKVSESEPKETDTLEKQSESKETEEPEAMSEGEQEEEEEEEEEEGSSKEDHIEEETAVSDTSKLDDSEEIVELPVHKEPAMLVDLAIEDETPKKNRKKGSEKRNSGSDSSDDKGVTSDGKKIKLRSLASLVDVNSEDETPADSAVSTSHPDIPAIGEIVEHGVIIGSDEMDGLQLRISNVVGGEDCITGLTVDEDRDSFPPIQISSVTTLINPISPEDPNQMNDDSEKTKDSEKEDGTDDTVKDKEPQTNSSEASSEGVTGDEAALSKDDGKKDAESSKDSSDAVEKTAGKESQSSDPAGPKIRLSSAVSEVAKDVGSTNEIEGRHIYHILRSILTVKRECIICCKNVQCEFRIVKKLESGTWAFLCSSTCRSQWTASLTSNHVVEKPRLIFEKLCGMCGKDLSNLPRDGQFSWETREFCSKTCLTEHLNEVAGKCYMCQAKVRTMLIGKYCVRFGSDIHQFCSNTCLECYKTKIKVCCYCQKNLEKVVKVTSVSNKEYCSTKCLKRAQRRDIGQQNHNEAFPCTVCQTHNLNRYEFVTNQESFQLCSDPCLNVYKYANKVKAVPCCLCFRVMNAEDVSHYLYHGGHQLRVFCSDSCVNVFILSARKIVICESCKVKKYNFDMIHRQVDEDFRDYFYCSLSCLTSIDPNTGKKNKNGITSSAVVNGSVTSTNNPDPPVTHCNMCNTMAKAQYHMVMSDNTLRSFCRYVCASKYKTTFGFQVNGIQSSDSAETTTATTTAPNIREKSTIMTAPTTQIEDTENVAQTKKKAVGDSLEDVASVTAELLKLLAPPTMVNKTTSCRPNTMTKGVFCKPHPWHRTTQTESSDINCDLYTAKPPPVLPVPVPVYVPTPMVTCNIPYPVPVFVPVPLPVPVFIPTTAKTTKDIAKMMNKIQDEMPEDPFEAEMLLLARASCESAEAEVEAEAEAGGEIEPEKMMEQTLEIPSEIPSAASDYDSHGDIDDLKDIDVSCLDNLEDDIRRYCLKQLDDSDILDTNLLSDDNSYSEGEEEEEQISKKRKLQAEDESPRKRPCNSGRRESGSDGREIQAFSPGYTTEHLEEEYPCPDLNKVYGLAAWKKWVTAKNAELAGVSSSRSMKMISDDLLAMNCEELNYALCLFLKDLRKSNGESYEPDTVFYLLLGIQQHLFDSARTDCIFMDFGFEKFTNSFDEITKNFVNASILSDGEISSEVGVTRITESMLWECRQLGAHTPQVLLNTLFYFNTKIFKFKTIEEHQELAFPKIVKQWRKTSVSPEGSVVRTTLLKYFAPKKDGKKRVFEMHENKEDPLRCPVKLYEFFLSKCPESLRNQAGMYYVYPERSCVPDSPVWFSSQSVQPASLSKMLHRVLMVKEVQEAIIDI